jgi:hypothetical protein
MGVTTSFSIDSKTKLNVQLPDNLSKQTRTSFTVYPEIDLVKFEVEAIQNFISGKGIFSADKDPIAAKGILVLRYGVEDDRALEMFKQIRRSGLHSAVLVTDGPITMNSKGPKFETTVDRNGQTVEERFSNDIRPEYLSDRANGPDVKSMLDADYKMYSPVLPKEGNLIQAGDFYVAMSAIANPTSDRKPIMHEKEVILYVLKNPKGDVVPENIKNLYVMHGTGNWTRIHVNRNFIYRDSSKSQEGAGFFALKHAFNTLETFVRKGMSARISDIPTPGRQRVTDSQGNFWEAAYTDGKYELNQRMADEFNVMAGDEETLQRLSEGNPEKYKNLKSVSETIEVGEIVLSHFVMTNTKVVEAIFNLWQAQNAKGKPFFIRGALDAKFVGLRSFGLGAIMAGYDTKTDFGKTRRALGKNFSKYVDVAVHMEETVNPDGTPVTNIDPDGPPSDRVLWHDKTTQIKFKTSPNSEWRSYIFTGSYNNSNNFNNLERQDWLSVPAESEISVAVNSSIRSAVSAALKESKYGKKKALPLEKGVFVKELANFLGQSPIDLDWNETLALKEKLESIHKKTKAEQAAFMKDISVVMRKMASKPSRLISYLQVKPEDLNMRLGSMSRFYSWYLSLPRYRQGFDFAISANEMLSLGLSILEKPFSAKMALLDILWSPNVPKHILEARAFRIYEYMELDKVFAKKLKDWKSDKKPFESEKFPFSEDVVFTVDLMDTATQKSLTDLVEARKLSEASKVLSQWVEKNKTQLGSKVALAASTAEVQSRLQGFVGLLDWYKALPADPAFKYPVVDLETSTLIGQLLSENMDLLLLKEQPMDKLTETIKYIVALKGYRDGKDGSPGALSQKTSEGLRVVSEASKGKTGKSAFPVKEVSRLQAPQCRALMM